MESDRRPESLGTTGVVQSVAEFPELGAEPLFPVMPTLKELSEVRRVRQEEPEHLRVTSQGSVNVPSGGSVRSPGGQSAGGSMETWTIRGSLKRHSTSSSMP